MLPREKTSLFHQWILWTYQCSGWSTPNTTKCRATSQRNSVFYRPSYRARFASTRIAGDWVVCGGVSVLVYSRRQSTEMTLSNHKEAWMKCEKSSTDASAPHDMAYNEYLLEFLSLINGHKEKYYLTSMRSIVSDWMRLQKRYCAGFRPALSNQESLEGKAPKNASEFVLRSAPACLPGPARHLPPLRPVPGLLSDKRNPAKCSKRWTHLIYL